MQVRNLIALAALILSALPSIAGSFSVDPIRIELSAKRPNASLRLTNEGSQVVLLQIHAVRWSLDAQARQVETPTDDVILNPPIVRVGPGSMQTIRLGLRHSVDPNEEVAYRLIVEEVPSQAAGAGLRTVLRISLPIFVQPLVSADARLQWAASRDLAGGLVITATNNGRRHVQVKELLLAHESVLEPQVAFSKPLYLLPGASYRWEISDRKLLPVGAIRISALTDAGSLHAVVKVSP